MNIVIKENYLSKEKHFPKLMVNKYNTRLIVFLEIVQTELC
jgi:hypothetical protein